MGLLGVFAFVCSQNFWYLLLYWKFKGSLEGSRGLTLLPTTAFTKRTAFLLSSFTQQCVNEHYRHRHQSLCEPTNHTSEDIRTSHKTLLRPLENLHFKTGSGPALHQPGKQTF